MYKADIDAWFPFSVNCVSQSIALREAALSWLPNETAMPLSYNSKIPHITEIRVECIFLVTR